MSPEALKRLVRSRALLVLLAISLLAWVAWAWIDVGVAIRWAQSLHGPVPAFVLVPLQTAISLSFSPIPSDVVGIALCVVYGFGRGTVLVWFAWMLGAWIEYALIRRMARQVVRGEEEARRRLPSWLQRLPVDHAGFLICGRWFPLGPHLVNSAAGAARVPLWRFSWTAAVGIAPVAVIVAAVATGILAASSPDPAPAAPEDTPQLEEV